MPRRYPIFQFPNAPLIVAMLSGAAARTSEGRTARAMAIMSALARLVWAYQEITDGANGFRRMVGVGGAAWAGAELARTAKPSSRFRSNDPATGLRQPGGVAVHSTHSHPVNVRAF